MTISAPLLWVALPIVMAVIVALLEKRKKLSIILASGTALFLGGFAQFFPGEQTLDIGPLLIVFQDELGFFGRQIILSRDIYPFIALLFLMTGLWNLASGLSGVPSVFRPISLTMTALLTASLGVKPFLYAALIMEVAILLSIPMLSPQGKKPAAGVQRYLLFQTLAVPFILMAGWLLTGVETLPPESPRILQATLLLGLGLALWLAVFPFHSWVPMLTQKSSPLASSFLLFVLPSTLTIFSLNFLDRYAFLRESALLFEALRVIGVIMIVLGGIWSAVQSDLKRVLGYAALSEIGFSLLAIGLASEGGLIWMVTMIPVRGLSFWFWGIMLSRIEGKVADTTVQRLPGFARQFPALSIGLLIAQLNMAGLPLLAQFPIKLQLLTTALRANQWIGILTFMGSLGLFLFTLRLLAVMMAASTEELVRKPSETAFQVGSMVLIVAALVLIGLFPGVFLSGFSKIISTFTKLLSFN